MGRPWGFLGGLREKKPPDGPHLIVAILLMLNLFANLFLLVLYLVCCGRLGLHFPVPRPCWSRTCPLAAPQGPSSALVVLLHIIKHWLVIARSPIRNNRYARPLTDPPKPPQAPPKDPPGGPKGTLRIPKRSTHGSPSDPWANRGTSRVPKDPQAPQKV